jgi:hypothetical protein
MNRKESPLSQNEAPAIDVEQPSKDIDPETEELAYFIQKHLDRITVNLGRVSALVRLADIVYPNPPPNFTIHREDLLRAAVVFLHATLEDFLRYIGATYLPAGKEEVLNRIALVGAEDVLRPEKFFLGKLAEHRGKTVDQLITESVASSLERMSFSDTADVSRLLEGAGVDLEVVREFYPTLTALMRRRHQIVHRGDLVDAPKNGPRDANPIDAATVTEWHGTVKRFISHVIADKIRQDFVPKLKAKHPDANASQSKPS